MGTVVASGLWCKVNEIIYEIYFFVCRIISFCRNTGISQCPAYYRSIESNRRKNERNNIQCNVIIYKNKLLICCKTRIPNTVFSELNYLILSKQHSLVKMAELINKPLSTISPKILNASKFHTTFASLHFYFSKIVEFSQVSKFVLWL